MALNTFLFSTLVCIICRGLEFGVRLCLMLINKLRRLIYGILILSILIGVLAYQNSQFVPPIILSHPILKNLTLKKNQEPGTHKKIEQKIVHATLSADESSVSSEVEATQKPSSSQSDPPEQNKSMTSETNECMERINSQIGHENFLIKYEKDLNKDWDSWIINKKATSLPDGFDSGREGNLFLTALAQVGLLKGRELPLNELDAFDHLSFIHQQNNDNSAPLIFMGIIAERNSKKNAELKNIFTNIAMTKYFNSFMGDLSRSIVEHVTDPAEFVGAFALVSELPIPDYIAVQKFITKHKLDLVAHQLVKANYSPDRQAEFLDWFAIEYAVGIKALNNLKIAHEFPESREYIREKAKANPIVPESLNAEIEKSCDLRTFEPAVENLKKYLADKPKRPKK